MSIRFNTQNMLTWIKSSRRLFFLTALLAVIVLAIINRFYQPVTQTSLLQFDIFDWMTRSKEVLLYGHMQTPTTLWLFPTFNAWVSKLSGLDLFTIYLYGGAVITTLNIIFLVAIAKLLWPKQLMPIVVLVFFYAINSQLLARSINYLPETMTYSFGLALVYSYIFLFIRKSWKVIPIILFLTYLFYHLHQSGLNFILFSLLAIVAYLIWFAPLTRRNRLILLFGGSLCALAIVLLSDPLRQQFIFFLQGSTNADSAFQGDAIPLKRFFSDYPLPFIIFFIFGFCIIFLSYVRKTTVEMRLCYSLLLALSLFYFSFLYVLPNLKLYSLIPWRFYTWFSLYAIFLVSIGFLGFLQMFRQQFWIKALVLAFISITLFHGNVLPDNMYTADRKTLESIANTGVPEGSTILTTNANHLQTRYSLLGKDITVREVGPVFFRADSAKTASTYLQDRLDGRPTYILVSKFQLRQRPASIDYWRNSALFDMDITKFSDVGYFSPIFEDHNVVVYRVRETL